MSIFKLPDLGEGLPDAEIVEWHVKEGDTVKTDEPMVSMETAKAVVDVPCPQDGVVVKLYGEPGDVIDTGSPLIEFASSDAQASGDTPQKLREEAEEVLKDLQDEKSEKKEEAIGTVVGQMESSDKVVADYQEVDGKKVVPAVRALARKLGVDLSLVTPTGPDGVIRPSDVKKAAADGNAVSKPKPKPEQQATLPLEEPKQTAPKAAAKKAAKPAATKTTATGDWEQVKGTRRAMARTMAASHEQVVPTTLMDDADIHAWQPGEDITARLIRALVIGSATEPSLNAWFDGNKLARRLIPHVDIGIAVDTPDGLFVPTLRNCDSLNREQVRARMNEIKDQVKSRSIPAEDMKDYTIMLSNFGVFAGRYATPVITPPCVAIIAAGKLCHEVVPVMGGMEVHRMIPLSLTFDHRAVTGGEAARFLAAMLKDLSLPR
ncbi:dihydrolipoamide acetyltransferase family protein [Marinicella sp. W31]|uniref:dihydrolipoamide acetyltransferase family protein n=1 Tax=Marinicella sp. W31 TaxID=3023713 RepID=UPI003757524A